MICLQLKGPKKNLMKCMDKIDFVLNCGVCKRNFNALQRNTWNYYYDFRFIEIIVCSNRCETIYLASNAATKDFDEALKLTG